MTTKPEATAAGGPVAQRLTEEPRAAEESKQLHTAAPVGEDFVELAPQFAEALDNCDFSQSGLTQLCGPDAVAALYRGEPEALAWALDHPPIDPDVEDSGEGDAATNETLRFLVRALILREPISPADLARALGGELSQQLIACGAFTCASREPQRVISAIDTRPVVLSNEQHIVFSDPDASIVPTAQPMEHVAGLGQASLTLARSVPSSPVDSLLDLGCGCGAQSLAQLGCARHVVATDVASRAVTFTRATLAGARSAIEPTLRPRIEVLKGAWFEPVAGRRFERIVSNPPFVVSPPEVDHIYRDSGLGLDNASKLVVSGAPEHLVPGGRAHLLAAWTHVAGEPWQARVAGWLPDSGVEAWVLERDCVDPATYVATWLRDEGVDPRSRNGRSKTRRWLNYLAQNEVEAIGFGFIAIENTGQPRSSVVAEELTAAFDDPLGPEVAEYFDRASWLRERGGEEILEARYRLRPGLAREEVTVADMDAQIGFEAAALRLTRTEGPRWSHEVDSHVAAIVAGLHPQGLTAGDVLELYAAAHGLDAAELHEPVAAILTDLVRHGLVLPADLRTDAASTSFEHLANTAAPPSHDQKE